MNNNLLVFELVDIECRVARLRQQRRQEFLLPHCNNNNIRKTINQIVSQRSKTSAAKSQSEIAHEPVPGVIVVARTVPSSSSACI